MKPRKVTITLKALSDLPIDQLRGAWRYDIYVDGRRVSVERFKVLSVNVVRDEKKKGKKR